MKKRPWYRTATAGWFVGVVVLAIGLFLRVGPSELELEPLPWDMSHHLLGAMQLSHGTGDVLAGDLYPPGHSILLGSWFAVWGDDLGSWRVFLLVSLVMCVLSLRVCSLALAPGDRLAFLVAGSCLLLATPAVLTLASTFLLEVPSATLALAACGGLAWLARAETPRQRILGAVAAGASMAATLLTKYNVGLPLLPAAGVLAVWLWVREAKRPQSVAVLAAATAAGGAWVLFLTLQHQGWRFFFAFAENRANTLDLGTFARLYRYVRIYANQYTVHAEMGGLVVLLAIVAGWRRPQALTLVATTYVLITLAALSRHPYVLSRNLFAAAVVLTMLAGIGAAAIWRDLLQPRPPVARAVAVAAGLLATVMLTQAAAIAHERVDDCYPGDDGGLREASDFLAAELARPGSCRLVGTFNELSGGWARVLAEREYRSSAPPPLRIEFPYPLERLRTGRDPRPDPAYEETVEHWLAGPENRVITIEVAKGSRWWSDGYRRYASWKQNYIDALVHQPELQEVRSLETADAGLRLRVLEPCRAQLVLGTGWGAAEPWGRWALAHRATITVTCESPSMRLRLRYAAFKGMNPPQVCRIKLNGSPVDSFTVTGRHWQWQERLVTLDVPGNHTVELEFANRYRVEGRELALPFAVVELSGAAPD